MIAKKEMYSPHVRESGFRNSGNFCLGSGILDFGIQNPRLGIQNPRLSWIRQLAWGEW